MSERETLHSSLSREEGRVPDFVSGAAGRADKLDKLAKQAEAITWSTPAVLRENATLIRALLGEIATVQHERDLLMRKLGIGSMGELPSGHV